MQYQELPVRSDSMWPWLRVGDRAVIEWSENVEKNAHEGDILVALPQEQEKLLTHRLVNIQGSLCLKADCQIAADAQNLSYVGRVIGRKRYGKIWYWQQEFYRGLFQRIARISSRMVSASSKSGQTRQPRGGILLRGLLFLQFSCYVIAVLRRGFMR